jgi:hypothetical protein
LNHYVSELVLLHVTRIACREFETLGEGLQRKPRCAISGWEEIGRQVDEADRRTAYAWFLGGGPTDYDRVTTANILEWRDKDRRDPGALADGQVAYPENPPQRLAHLHWSFQELTTGHAYASPWQRHDGWRYA